MFFKVLTTALTILKSLVLVLESVSNSKLNPSWDEKAREDVERLKSGVNVLLGTVSEIQERSTSQTRNELPLGGTHEKSDSTPFKPSD